MPRFIVQASATDDLYESADRVRTITAKTVVGACREFVNRDAAAGKDLLQFYDVYDNDERAMWWGTFRLLSPAANTFEQVRLPDQEI